MGYNKKRSAVYNVQTVPYMILMQYDEVLHARWSMKMLFSY
jgi:hypothetical protein